MGTYDAVKLRIMQLCKEKNMTINKLATESGVPPSSVKNILYGKSQNLGIVTLKMICDGFEISLPDFFNCDIFFELEQEIK